MKGMLGKKLGMTSVFSEDGSIVPVTVVQVGPCVITQIKTEATDGYNALQIGFESKKDKHTTKPLKGHFSKSGGGNYRHLREFRVDGTEDFTLGQEVAVDLFKVGEFVDITGTTKGRGFSGVMKRHGCRSHRIPGSVGCSAWPAKIIKGKKMPGHYGVDRKTVRNLQIIDIRPEDNVVLVKGAVPGSKNGLLEIKKLKFV